jgi:dolichyl-phosphate beta-glucosyltransferase
MDNVRQLSGEEGQNAPVSLSVVIPAYNEAGRIVRTLDATADFLDGRGERYEILVVDDGSRDTTRAVVEAWSASRQSILGSFEVLSYEGNRGKGYAVRYGILRSRGNHILFMDADLATPIEEIRKLESAMTQNGAKIPFAIGSRDVKSSQLLVRQPFYREAAGRLFNKIVRMLATPGIHDTQCGFKLLAQDAAKNIFSRCTLDGFSFDVEAIYIARRLGYAIAEVPVRWAHQEGAAAFATKGAYLRHGLRMIRDLIRIRRTHRNLQQASANSSASLSANIATNHHLL